MIAPAALAQADLPPGSGLDQYVESVPGAEGNRAPGPGHPGHSPGARLPSSVTRQLSRDAQGRKLARLAADPAVGAPRKQARSGHTSARAKAADAGAGHQSIPAAATDALGGSSGGGIAVLLAIALIGSVGAVLAWRRARGRAAVR